MTDQPLKPSAMKIIVLFLTCTSFLQEAYCQQLSPFRIDGKFTADVPSARLYIVYPQKDKWMKDSCTVKNGVFSFTGKVEYPVLSKIMFNDREKEFFLEPATLKMVVKDEKLSDVVVSGPSNTTQFYRIDSNMNRIKGRWKTAMDTLFAVARRSNAAFQELKGWALTPYFAEVRELYQASFKKYPKSYVTAYYLAMNIIELNQGELPTPELQKYYDGFTASVKNSKYGQGVKTELGKREIAIPGKQAENFTQTDVNGKPLSLADFKGKYVLLDFWGSWCVPCRKGNPHLKELYNQYKDKGFDIIGIAADNRTQDAWKAAIEKDGLPWHHVLLGKLDDTYNITSYPTKILVDKNGTIIGRYGSEEEELNKMLHSVLGDVK